MKNALIILITSLLPAFSQAQDTPEYDRTPKMYFLVELVPNPETKMDQTERGKIQKEHTENIAKMASEKKLMMAGPFPKGGGLFFLSVPEYEEAVNLVEKDPTVKAKLNTYTIRPWITERGLFTLENQ